MRNLDKMLGTLYGQAIGDAMGMPTELWSQEKIKATFTTPITDFMPGPPNNKIGKYYQRGQYTNDTQQALIIIQTLHNSHWQVDQLSLGHHLLEWAKRVKAFERGLIGMETQVALEKLAQHEAANTETQNTMNNDAAIRIIPIGALFTPNRQTELVALVTKVSQVTHASDISISSACLIAGAVTAAVADYSWEAIVKFALSTSDLGLNKGFPTYAAKLRPRVHLGLQLSEKYQHNEAAFSKAIYEVIGTSPTSVESVATALVIAQYTQNVERCALFCANLGGDTAAIGAMATAICGAKNGWHRIPKAWCSLIDRQNPPVDIKGIGQQMLTFQIHGGEK